jgi:hypothetical protein
MVVISSVSFDENEASYKVYKERFEGTRDFSAWVRNKLIEEADQKNDPKFITEEIFQDIKLVEQVQHRIAKNKEKLEKIKQEQDAKILTVVEEPRKPDKENVLRNLRIIFESKYKIKDKQKLKELTEEFYELREKNPDRDRTVLMNEFIGGKNETSSI